MGWFGRKKKEEPKKESDVKTKEPEKPRQQFGIWRKDDRYVIKFSGEEGELTVSRRMYAFMDHFATKFMSLGSYNNETLMKQIWQLLEQHSLGFIEDYEEPEEPDEDEDDDVDDDDDEPEDEPEDEPDPAAEEDDEEVVDEPDPSVAEVPADVEAPAPLESVPSASLVGSEVS